MPRQTVKATKKNRTLVLIVAKKCVEMCGAFFIDLCKALDSHPGFQRARARVQDKV